MKSKNLKKELPPRLIAVLTRGAREVEVYGVVYKKCASPQALTGKEYAIAMELAEIGFMTYTRTPIWHNESFVGAKFIFLSYVPV